MKALKAVNNFLMGALYGGSLASPVLGAIAGGITHGLLGAGIGLFVGPVFAIAAILAYAGINRVLGVAASSSTRTKTPLIYRVKEFGKGTLRALAWALNLSVLVGTLGQVQLNLDGPRETSYNPNLNPPASPSGGLSRLSLKKIFHGSHSEKANKSVPDSGARPQEPKL